MCLVVVSFGLSAAPAMLDEDGGVDAMVTVTPTFPSGGSAVSFEVTVETEDGTAESMLISYIAAVSDRLM